MLFLASNFPAIFKAIGNHQVIPCTREVQHEYCFEERSKEEALLTNLRDAHVVCTNACYKKLLNPLNNRNRLEDPLSSEWILLNWLMIPENDANKLRDKAIEAKTKSKWGWKLLS